MLQKSVSQQIIKTYDCGCFSQDTFVGHYLKKSVVKIDLAKVQECVLGHSVKDHIERIDQNIVICTTPFNVEYIQVVEACQYSLISTDVTFERYHDDAIDQLEFDSDYSIVSGNTYTSVSKDNRIAEITAELAKMSYYGKNKKINFEGVYNLYQERLALAWNKDTIQIFAAVDFVGALSGFISLREDKEEIYIDFLAVHSSIRRKGIAQELIKRACFYAQELQKNIYASVQAENIASIRLYEKAGFIQKNFSLVYHKVTE